jgi:hypothetical protein
LETKDEASMRATYMTLFGTFLWAIAVVTFYIYLPQFWQPGGYGIPDNAMVFGLFFGLFFFLVILSVFWAENVMKSKNPSNTKIGRICNYFICNDRYDCISSNVWNVRKFRP